MYGRNATNYYFFNISTFSKFLHFFSFGGPQIWAAGAISPFFITHFLALGRNYNFQNACFDFLSYFPLHIW